MEFRWGLLPPTRCAATSSAFAIDHAGARACTNGRGARDLQGQEMPRNRVDRRIASRVGVPVALDAGVNVLSLPRLPGALEEEFLPFPAPIVTLGAASAVRSTLVTSSIQSLRQRGLGKRYESVLGGPHRETLLTSIAGVWLPVEAALTHYAACDRLGLDDATKLALGVEVGARVNGTLLGMLARMARTVGVTPWPALAQSGKLYGRLFCGGGIAVFKHGPKDASVQIVGNALCDIDYFRVGLGGVYQAALRHFCRQVHTSLSTGRRQPRSLVLQISWA
jgi:hypothetical protein